MSNKRLVILLSIGLLPMVICAQDLHFAQTGTFQLADPIVQFDRILFQESAMITLDAALENTSIFYTLNGEDPTIGSTLYQHPIVLTESAVVKVRAFHPDCRSSEVVSQQFLQVKRPLDVKKCVLTNQPAKQYSGQGGQSLFDLQKGSLDFHDGHWLGFNGNDLEVDLELKEATSFSSLTISNLKNQSSWIFPIRKIEIYSSDDGQAYTLIQSEEYAEGDTPFPAAQIFKTLVFRPVKTRFLKIKALNQGEIPAWHPGAGTPAWLFIDEIILR